MMSSTEVVNPAKVEGPQEKPGNKIQAKDGDKPLKRRSTFNSSYPAKKYKHENEGRNHKFGRKRLQSLGNGKFFPPYKRRKKEGLIIPPTKFLLGGNIYDPLNLNSLQDEEINRAMNAVTPKSSPVPTPRHRKGEVEVIIPRNFKDPLNLTTCQDDAEYEQQLVSPVKKGRKQRHKKRKRNSSGGASKEEKAPEGSALNSSNDEPNNGDESKACAPSEGVDVSKLVAADGPPKKDAKDLDLPLRRDSIKRVRKMDPKDKIVSPVIPQPGAWKRPPPYRGGANQEGRCYRHRQNRRKKQLEANTPNFRPNDVKFQYGNYPKYYGYRNPNHEEDQRLKVFAEHRDLFAGKDILDIGCNIGHVTLSVARDLGARSAVGLDIDRHLIAVARKNVRHYVTWDSPRPDQAPAKDRFFPISMPICYGPIDVPGFSPTPTNTFPKNVTFVQGNYVLDSDELLATEKPQFDVILCLSITKWLHLNWGDAGLKQAFRRMYLQLRPGGKLVLEAQAWESYKKKKGLTEKIFNNFKTITFFPHKFSEYLLSSEVGFTLCEVMATPFHSSKGFQRPIQIFTKGEISPSHSVGSAASVRGPVYATHALLTEDEMTEVEDVTEILSQVVNSVAESEDTREVESGVSNVLVGLVNSVVESSSTLTGLSAANSGVPEGSEVVSATANSEGSRKTYNSDEFEESSPKCNPEVSHRMPAADQTCSPADEQMSGEKMEIFHADAVEDQMVTCISNSNSDQDGKSNNQHSGSPVDGGMQIDGENQNKQTTTGGSKQDAVIN